MAIDGAFAFRIATPLGFTVRCTNTYWSFIVSHKHPIMLGRDAEIKIVLADPDESAEVERIRMSFSFTGAIRQDGCAR
jgi:hypothetical protein